MEGSDKNWRYSVTFKRGLDIQIFGSDKKTKTSVNFGETSVKNAKSSVNFAKTSDIYYD